MQSATCLVTGAAGFIGSHLVRRLVACGCQVHAFVRPASGIGRIVDLADRIAIHRVDLADRAGVARYVAEIQPDFVFHLAAETRATAERSIAATRLSVDSSNAPLLNLVEALQSAAVPPRLMVRAGTLAEYGVAALPYHEDMREAPVTPYGASQLAGTHYLEMLGDVLRYPVVTARLALTYGKGQSRDFLIPALIDACLAGESFAIRRPDDRRDLIHVDDVVDGLLRLCEMPDAGCTRVNIGTGHAPSMRQVAQAVIGASGCDPRLVRFEGTPDAPPPIELRCDPSIARELYGWQSRIGLEDGLAELVQSAAPKITAMGQCYG